jgi:hypothetical protein
MIRGVVEDITGNVVTVAIVEVNTSNERTPDNAFIPTGENREIEFIDDIPLVIFTRGASGIEESATSFSNISINDMLNLFYNEDGSIEKIQLVQR